MVMESTFNLIEVQFEREIGISLRFVWMLEFLLVRRNRVL